MIETFLLTAEQLFEEIVDRGKLAMVTTKEAYDELVEEVIEDRTDVDELDIDEDTEGMETHLKERWSEYLQRIEA